MARTLYKAKTMTGAEREVRLLRRRLAEVNELLGEYAKTRKLMAMLAAEGPAFNNPLVVYEAKEVRDRILRNECRMKPDGSPL